MLRYIIIEKDNGFSTSLKGKGKLGNSSSIELAVKKAVKDAEKKKKSLDEFKIYIKDLEGDINEINIDDDDLENMGIEVEDSDDDDDFDFDDLDDDDDDDEDRKKVKTKGIDISYRPNIDLVKSTSKAFEGLF